MTDVIEENIRNSGYNLAKELIQSKTPFKIIFFNLNNWDKPLPQYVMKEFPYQYALDFEEDIIKKIKVTDNEIHLKTIIDDIEYSKILYAEEIAGLADIYGTTIFINPFEPQTVTPDREELFDWDDIKQGLVNELGLDEKHVKRSIQAFKKSKKN